MVKSSVVFCILHAFFACILHASGYGETERADGKDWVSGNVRSNSLRNWKLNRLTEIMTIWWLTMTYVSNKDLRVGWEPSGAHFGYLET